MKAKLKKKVMESGEEEKKGKYAKKVKRRGKQRTEDVRLRMEGGTSDRYCNLNNSNALKLP